MKNNYPIKYAVMPIIAQTGWVPGMHDMEREYGEIAYIASKCYLVGEEKKYLKDGKTKTNYKVVFPYEENDFNIWKRIEPEFKNYKIVDSIFDSLADALKESEKKNNELLLNKMKYIPFEKNKEKLRQIEQDFHYQLNYYKSLEKLIEEKTKDLNLNNILKEQTIVIVGDGKNNKYNISLYDAMSLWNKEEYVVYNLNEQEYIDIITDIQNGLDLSKYNKRCIAINNPKENVVKIKDSESLSVCYLTSNELIIDNKESFDSMDFYEANKKIIFYTLENYQDIVDSYITINNSTEINEKMLKKEYKY